MPERESVDFRRDGLEVTEWFAFLQSKQYLIQLWIFLGDFYCAIPVMRLIQQN